MYSRDHKDYITIYLHFMMEPVYSYRKQDAIHFEHCLLQQFDLSALISCIFNRYQYHMIDQSATIHYPITDHSLIPHPAITQPSPSHHPPLNKTTTITDCEVLFLISIQQLFIGCLMYICNIIDCLLQKTIIITFELVRILLETSLSMAKLLHWCCHICNVIQSWILRNYCLIWINIVNVYHSDVVSHTIGYIYVIWVIEDAVHSDCIHKLYANGIIDYNLDGIDPITLEMDVTRSIVMFLHDCPSKVMICTIPEKHN